MKYLFDYSKDDIVTRICKLNNIDYDTLDVSGFEPDYSLTLLNDFKELLLSYKDKRFFIVGDYDCDGICATTIMKKLFDDLGIKSNYYIPSRSKDGYGLNERIVDNAILNNFDVLLCVDNGINAHEQLKKAKDNGLHTLVIDHHEYDHFPDVDGYLHPDLFPIEYKDMCAAGLCALLSNCFRADDLTTAYGGLATLADMVSVLGYNRYLIKQAIRLIEEKKVSSISNLMGSSLVNTDSLSYNVIPKINAVSRLEEDLNVNYVVKYLLNEGDVYTYLNKIEMINLKRKDYTKQMYGLAKRLIDETQNIIMIKSDVFAEGLCGLLSNRIMSEYDKPVIILSEHDGLLKGSGRSPAGFDLYRHLKQFEDLYVNYGGHQQAVGLTMNLDNYEILKEKLNNSKVDIEEIYHNALVVDINDINDDMLKQIESLKPFGTGFIEPSLALENVNVERQFIVAKQYPKFVLNENIEAISFNSKHIDKEFDKMIGMIKHDDYHKDKISFIIEDLI